MKHSYHREKVGAAIHCLAGSALPIQKRLEYAWTAMHTLTNHKFADPELQEKFDDIYERLTADKTDAQEGYVPKTTRNLSDDDAAAIADLIVDLDRALDWDLRGKLMDEVKRFGGDPYSL